MNKKKIDLNAKHAITTKSSELMNERGNTSIGEKLGQYCTSNKKITAANDTH